MELEQIIQLSASPEDLKKAIEAEKPTSEGVADLIKQFKLEEHEVMKQDKRRDKTVTTDEGTRIEPVIRLPLPLQRQIVNQSAAFLCGNPIELQAEPEADVEKNLLAVLKKTWEDNKLDYKSKGIAKRVMSECECAELWYTEPVDPLYWEGTPNQGKAFRLRVRILAPSLGDDLFPVFNLSGDMVAFARGYKLTIAGKKEEHFDVYTEKSIYKYAKNDGGWQALPAEGNIVGKIPVIYYSQPLPEWAEVQPLISRLEESLSDHGDTNKYFGFPMMVATGEVQGFAKKGDTGKFLQLADGATLTTISWDRSPESVALEQKNLRSFIMDLTSTSDISFEQMKGLGDLSGIALKMLFLAPHMKAADKEEMFGECVQRRINYLKEAHAKINVTLDKGKALSIRPKFEYFLPKNDKEAIENLTTAVTGGIMSAETGTAQNPLVEDGAVEWVKMGKEKAARANSPVSLDEEMN